MAATFPGWIEPTPELTRAAEAGDTRAMVLLGQADLPDGERERWLRTAAAAGDPEGMYALGRFHWDHHLSDPDAKGHALQWYVAAARAGHVAAMLSAASLSRGRGREYWLRRAAEAGDAWGAHRLADVLAERDPAEAERWYRLASDRGSAGARLSLADLLAGQGRDIEAERWREVGLTFDVGEQARSQTLETVVVTAVATTALVPFLQALAGKAAEDVYAALRRLLGRRARRPDPPPGDEDGTELLVVADPDGGVELYVWLNDSEEAVRALAELDVQRLLRNRVWSGTAALVWDRGAHAWRLRLPAGE